MNSPLISIIIPTFNSGGSIGGAIQSILQQSFVDYEVLIMDGSSLDNSLNIVRSFPDPRIRIYSEKDEGLYYAMNKGISLSRGSWIYFLGSDDKLYDPSVLERVAAKLITTSAEVVYGNVKLDGDTHWARHHEIYDGEFTRDKLCKKNICHQAIFYSKIVFQRIGKYNTDYTVCADWDFNHHCFASCKMEYIDEIIALFKGGGKSSFNSTDKYSSEEVVINLKKYYQLKYSDSLFKKYAKVFLNVAKKQLIERKFFSSFYFYAIAMFHSDNKIYFLKNYMLAINQFIRS